MTSKEWLRMIRSGMKRVEQLKKTKEKLLEAATGLTAQYGGEVVSNSNTSRKPEDYVVNTSAQDRQIENWLRKINATTEAIYEIDNAQLQSVLELYYIQCLNWDQVAEVMGYSRSHVTQYLHSKALKAFKVPKVNTQ